MTLKTVEDRMQRERERQEIVQKAVKAADHILLDGSDGSVEEVGWLTSQIAKRFVEKVDIAVTAKLRRRDLELVPEEYYAIFSPLIDEVIGICADVGKSNVMEEEPECLFVFLTEEQFDRYGEDPEDGWTQLDQIGIEKPKSQRETGH